MRHLFVLLACSLLALAITSEKGQGQTAGKDLQGDPLPTGAVARLGTLRFRHNANIAFAAFVNNGKAVVSVGEDGVICVWEFPSGKPIHRIDAYPSKNPPADPNNLAFGPNRSFLNAAAISPDGKVLATSFGVSLRFGGNPPGKEPPTELGVIKLHDLASGKELKVLKGDAEGVTALAFSPDGTRLTAWHSGNDPDFGTMNRDNFIRIWDWANAKQLAKTPTVGVAPISLGYYGDPFGYPIYSPDGKTLMLYGTSALLQFVDTTTGKKIGPDMGHVSPLTSIAFTSDGKQLLTQTANSAQRWDAVTSKELGAITVPPKMSNARAISPDGKIGVALPADNQFADPLGALGGFGGPGGFGGAIPIKGGKQSDALVAAVGGGIGLAMFAPKAVFKARDTVLVLFDTADGKELGKITLAPGAGTGTMIFAPDGKTLAVTATSGEPKVNFYEVPTGKLLRGSDSLPEAVRVLKGKGGFAVAGPAGLNVMSKMLFSPDGKLLALHAGDGAATIIFLDVATGKRLGSFPGMVNNVSTTLSAFSPDGRCLALEMSDGTLTVLELASGQHRRSYGKKAPPSDQGGFGGPGGFVGVGGFMGPGGFIGVARSALCAFSPDGKLLAHAGADRVLHVWDLLTGDERAAFKGHSAPLYALAFAPNGKRLASASGDTTALIWDMTAVKQPAPGAKALKPEDADKLWQALSDSDAGKAFDALQNFADAPKDTVAFIKQKLEPAAPLDQKRVDELLEQLDHNQFKVREKATLELLKIGDQIVPIIEKELAGTPSAEAKKRLEEVRGKLTGMVLQGERLRVFRTVEILERIGTPQARQLLEALAAGAPRALVTTSAQASLNRLK
ncbi:MAG TPA: hypothetical protein VE988_19550 [Gemmataceae bacterium]|nr:hypothetical protein [Gemmataceae bacterium]